MDFVANFNLEEHQFDAQFELEEPTQFDAVFKINPAGASWGSITGNIQNQTDLKNALDSKANTSDLSALGNEISALSDEVDNNYTEITNRLENDEEIVSGLSDTISSYGDIVTHDADEFATAEQGTLANTALQPGDNISELVNNAGYITSSSIPTVNNGILTIQQNGVDVVTFGANSSEDKTANITVPTDTNDLTNGAGYITSSALTNYVTTNTAQTITANKTFHNAELITDNMITLNGSTAFLRGLKGIEYRNLIKLNSSGVTVGSTNEVLTINGSGTRPKYNSGDLALYSDIPTVNDGKLALQVNSTDVGEFTANQSSNTTVNISVPTDTSDLTNGAGFLVNNGTGTKALAVGDTSQSTAEGGVAIGNGSKANSTYSTAIGQNASATNTNTTVIGRAAKATQARAIAIGSGSEANAQDAIAIKGINNTANTFQVYTYNMLDMSTGLIPDARISTNIARTSAIPTDTSDLTNGAGYITGITSGDVTTALGYTPYNSSNPDGYITSSALANYVTTNTDQNITGTKTFVGQKKIGFKQSSSSDKLGFTLYNNSGTEKGYLEYNPSNTVDSVPLMTLGNYASASGGLTHVGFRKYSSISGASGAYNLLAPLVSDAKTPFSLTTTYTNFYLPLGFTDGNTTVLTAKSGMVDISPLLPSGSVVDQVYDATSANAQSGVAIAGAGFLTGITSADVTNALGYTPYDASNPNGYTSNVGTVTSVNNTSPDGSGNVSLTIPSYSDFTGADGVNAGSSGLVPAPSATDNTKFLKGDGTWATVSGGGTTYTAGTGVIIDNNDEISVAQTDAQEGRYTWSNLTEVGTLTESHKVYSGFSSSAYLAMTSYPTTISSLEIQWDITTPADVQTWGCIMGQSSNNFKTPQFEVEDGKFDFVISSNGTSWTTWMECACQASTHYILNFSWDGTYYNATLTDDNNNVTNFTLHSGSATGSSIKWTEVAWIGRDSVSSGFWNGSINIGNSYIKVNGALFDISMNNVGDVAKATSSLYGLVKPDNTTITISDGVISSTREVFIATYNTTSFSEIETAYNAGKSVFVKDYGLLVPLINYDVSRASFRGIGRGSGTYNFRCVEITATLNGSSTTWNNVAYQLELTRNLVTSISSSSTDTQYPSAKCVYDIPHVTETYSNGTEGWRKWSDGYYEEWGYWNRNTSIGAGNQADTTILLLNSFGNTNYNTAVACRYTSTNIAMGEELKISSVTNNSFKIVAYNRNSGTASGAGVGVDWRVCGYITV